ncbi:polysaccharide deacetylase family protein [Brumimicrobium oceani]|uniref:Polysaccharide deacetylase n=1 Tax=Brumimicrobium oceani TaxID=2100725 RepID=A0A2U2XHF6_9FLAO|nr:polysaccharide deacetylase family protein [Brumimicrobium oceani]PWH87224.1 polysaccharide deacetylase [Brumimicrobium oceani]
MRFNMQHKNLYLLLILIGISFSNPLYTQTKIAITIDDVPNTRVFKANNYNSILLNKLDSLSIPICIFVNEGLIYKQDSIFKNKELLNEWAKRDYITLGNHTFGHSKYSEVGFEEFKKDLIKGEPLLNSMAEKYDKKIQYFRFPYNDLGQDSLAQFKINNLLKTRNYISTPFTIESADWVYNYIYRYYLANSEWEKAEEIGQLYVEASLDFFHFFDSLSMEKYGRKINQIFLCHDSHLNEAYLVEIIAHLKSKKYNFVSLEEALLDPVYAQKSNYHKAKGISWMYRWMKTEEERKKWMKKEPDISEIEILFKELSDNR